MSRKDDLAKKLADEIENSISFHVQGINNPLIRDAVAESLREKVYYNLENALSGKVDDLVKDSMKNLLDSMQKPIANKRNPRSVLSKNFGGKNNDSGSKPSSRTTAPRRSSGGKGSGGK